jgi:hypothetical protein
MKQIFYEQIRHTVEMGNIEQVFNFKVKLKTLRDVLLSMV